MRTRPRRRRGEEDVGADLARAGEEEDQLREAGRRRERSEDDAGLGERAGPGRDVGDAREETVEREEEPSSSAQLLSQGRCLVRWSEARTAAATAALPAVPMYP